MNPRCFGNHFPCAQIADIERIGEVLEYIHPQSGGASLIRDGNFVLLNVTLYRCVHVAKYSIYSPLLYL